MDDDPLKNIALLIDADNASHAGIDPVLTVLAELGQVNIRRAYGNWAKPALAKWSQITHRYGLQPIQQFYLTNKDVFRRVDGRVTAEELQHAITRLAELGFLDKDLQVAPYVDNSYLPR